MLLAFKNHLQNRFPEVAHSRLLLAVSGGVDSVVLTHLCRKTGLEIGLAHCNFNLRNEESNADDEFVQALGHSLEIPVFVKNFQTEAYAGEHGLSIQVAARKLRYEWFENLRKSENYDFVCTGHHGNDDLETVLINLLRGTGLDGLTGIPEHNDHILRPMLPFSRYAIEQYARQSGLEWREDSSNSSPKYLRNRIRNEVVPLLKDLNPNLLQSFRKTRHHLNQSAVLVEDYIGALFPHIAREETFGYSFELKTLHSIPHLEAVLYELFHSFGFTQWEDINRLLESQSGKVVYSQTHRLIRGRNQLLLTTLPVPDSREFYLKEDEEIIMLPIGTFHIEEVSDYEDAGAHEVFLDKDKLEFPLHVRKWKKGDFFYPFGMKGKKKLSKFFKDEKLSLPQKENCWLLCSGERIAWVIGHRADARFGVDAKTTSILRISLTP